MLKKLSVSNFAIIENSEILFEKGFNIITGETGAGKSILLGALSLILGQRADKKSILNEEKKSVIEGTFSIEEKRFQPFFRGNDLDFEHNTIVRRELLPSGKSRAFINDTPVNLEVLKEFTSQVVDLHQQHESMSLTTADFQREVIDTYANITSEVEKYHAEYLSYKKEVSILAEKKAEEKQNHQEKDFLDFQFQELDKANLKKGELVAIEEELETSNNLEDVQSGIQTLNAFFEDEESGSIQTLRKALIELRKIAKLNTKFSTFEERLNSAVLDIEDISDSITSIEDDLTIDPERVEEMTKRSDLLNRLISKHQLQSDDELIEKFEEIKLQLNGFESISDEIIDLEKSIQKRKEILLISAEKISKKRFGIKTRLEKESQQLLAQVGMEKAKLILDITESDELNAYGNNLLKLLFTANSGQSPKELKQVASGGEVSRLMLAIKTLIAGKTFLPTMIFDEIDTGISGEVAMKVGNLLNELAKTHQIISITHLPQIAAKGNHHLKVFKDEVNNETRSQVVTLTKEQRVIEIAEMLSGANPSETSLQAAKELMKV